MILADKITEERKKLGLSQEELAEKLSVSRQAVSKWEGAQSIPDLQKIVMMSELFSVSTDYLLKDEIEPEKKSAVESDTGTAVRRVSMEEANSFMSAARQQGKTVALGVLLCVLSPVLLIFLCGLSAGGVCKITDNLACGAGLAALFIQVAAAVWIFIRSGNKSGRFDRLKKEEFETAYGVTGLVKEKRDAYEQTYIGFLSLGVVLCVLSPLPLIITALWNRSDTVIVCMTALLLCIVAVGVYMIVRVCTVMASFRILLQEGDYGKKEKKNSGAVPAFGGIYWSVAVAVYLIWSFATEDWGLTWIMWPVAGVLYAPLMMIAKLFKKS